MGQQPKPHRRQGLIYILGRIGAVLALACGMVPIFLSVLLVLTQDIQVFPGVIDGAFGPTLTPPSEVTPFMVTTSDGEQIPVWRMAGKAPHRSQVALLFHGNAETLATTGWTQRWFAERGLTTYAATYRGFRGSSGFPSERGIERDAEAAMHLLLREEQISPHQVVVFGNSIGTGPATYIAAKFKVGMLALIAPYTSIPDVTRERGWLRFLTPFLWYSIPSLERIATLQSTCVVVAHGKRDTIISYDHSVRLAQAYRGQAPFRFLSRDEADHFDIFGQVQTELATSLDRCFGSTTPGAPPAQAIAPSEEGSAPLPSLD